MRRLLFILLTVLSLISCQKEGGLATTLIGKWQVTKTEIEDVSHDGTTTLKGMAYVTNTFYLFTNDGTVKCFSKDGSVKEYVYSLDNNKMILKMGDITYYIKEYTRTTLVFYSSMAVWDGMGGGKQNLYFYLTKVK